MSWVTALEGREGFHRHATELIYTCRTRFRWPKNKHFYLYEEQLQLVEFAQLANDRCEVKRDDVRRGMNEKKQHPDTFIGCEAATCLLLPVAQRTL